MFSEINMIMYMKKLLFVCFITNLKVGGGCSLGFKQVIGMSPVTSLVVYYHRLKCPVKK